MLMFLLCKCNLVGEGFFLSWNLTDSLLFCREGKWKLLQNQDENVDILDLKLYHGESWELLIRRWAKLEKDFKMKDGRFDVSKIPDIYDCIKYDLQHNQKTIQYEEAKELFECSKALADIVIPQVCIVEVIIIDTFLSGIFHLSFWLIEKSIKLALCAHQCTCLIIIEKKSIYLVHELISICIFCNIHVLHLMVASGGKEL